MDFISLHPYHEGAAVLVGFALGILIGTIITNLAFGLCLGVGIGAVVNGIMRLRACNPMSN